MRTAAMGWMLTSSEQPSDRSWARGRRTSRCGSPSPSLSMYGVGLAAVLQPGTVSQLTQSSIHMCVVCVCVDGSHVHEDRHQL